MPMYKTTKRKTLEGDKKKEEALEKQAVVDIALYLKNAVNAVNAANAVLDLGQALIHM